MRVVFRGLERRGVLFVCVWAVYYIQIRKSEQRPPLYLRTADLVPLRWWSHSGGLFQTDPQGERNLTRHLPLSAGARDARAVQCDLQGAGCGGGEGVLDCGRACEMHEQHSGGAGRPRGGHVRGLSRGVTCHGRGLSRMRQGAPLAHGRCHWQLSTRESFVY